MSLFASLDVQNPIRSQSGSLFAPVIQRNIGCELGNSTHVQETIVQTGLGRSKKRTMNRRRKRSSTRKNKSQRKRKSKSKSKSQHKSKSKSQRKSRKTRRVNQVGRGTSYQNVLELTANAGPQGVARSGTAPAYTGAV